MKSLELLALTIIDGPKITVRSKQGTRKRNDYEHASEGDQISIKGGSIQNVKIAGDILNRPRPDDKGTSTIPIDGNPIFYDQTDYIFELNFDGLTSDARLFSPVPRWCELAESGWNPSTGTLIIPINFGNDLGDFELIFEWQQGEGETWHSLSLRGHVHSTKLDVRSHVPIMIKEVQHRFNWLQLDLFRTTMWDWKRDDLHDSSLQTWLAIFREVRTELSQSFAQLTHQHRRRLMANEYRVRADRIRRVRPRQEEGIAERLKERPNARFRVERKHLASDTPENRFMKHILASCVKTLAEISQRIKSIERISNLFKERIAEWEEEWSRILYQPFWRSLGEFRGLQKESLVLSQDPLYAHIRRNWIYLQRGVDLLDKDLQGGLQNVAQLYEIWCLVQLDRFICGMTTKPDESSTLWIPHGENEIPFERTDDDFASDEGRVGTIKLTYEYHNQRTITLDLLFQPTANQTPDHKHWDGMMSLPQNQCPDLVLRLHRADLPGAPTFTWIFDAKYRVTSQKSGSATEAPSDAINAMHRYRDAILWAADAKGEQGRLTRESLGAFVLYPGDERDPTKDPQFISIDRVNIGAFSLRPQVASTKEEPDKGTLLREKLASLLKVEDKSGASTSRLGESYQYYAAVPRVRDGSGLVVARCAIRSDMEDKGYWKTCRLYRLPVEREADVEIPAESWGWIVPTGNDGTPYGQFPVKRSVVLKRSQIEQVYARHKQDMKGRTAPPDRLYRLFYLDEPIPTDDCRSLPNGRVVDVSNATDYPAFKG